MQIVKREITTFPKSSEGRICAELYFNHIKQTGVTPCDFKEDDQGYHVAGGYVLEINERAMMEKERKQARRVTNE